MGFTHLQQGRTPWVDVHIPHRHTHTSHARLSLYSSCCNESSTAVWLNGSMIWDLSLKSTEAGNGKWWIYVSWHALLAHCPSQSPLLISGLYCKIFNPIYPKLTALYNSPFSFNTSSLSFLILLILSLFASFYFSTYMYVFIRLSLSPLPFSLLLSSWRRRCPPCPSWRRGICLNKITTTVTCSHLLAPLCSFLSTPGEEVALSVLHEKGVWRPATHTLQALSVGIWVIRVVLKL